MGKFDHSDSERNVSTVRTGAATQKRRPSPSVLMGTSNARNGELNKTFGVYITLCCDAEIFIGCGVPFPDCPNHRNLPTEWKQKPDVDPNTYTPNKSGKIALPTSKQQINLRG